MKTKNAKLWDAYCNVVQTYGKNTKLYDIPTAEFLTGGLITEMTKIVGYDTPAKAVVNDNVLWNFTVKGFGVLLADEDESKNV